MPLLCILLALFEIAFGQTDPVVIHEFAAHSPAKIVITGSDTLTLLWNAGYADSLVWQAKYVPGEDALLEPPAHAFADLGGRQVIYDAWRMTDGSLLATIRIASNSPPNSLHMVRTGQAPSSIVLFEGQWQGPMCWFSCYDMTNARISVRTSGDIFIAGSENGYFEISPGVLEVDSRPVVYRIDAEEFVVTSVYAVGDFVSFGECFPRVLSADADSLTILHGATYGPLDRIYTWPLANDTVFTHDIECGIVNYGEYEIAEMPTGSVLATNTDGLYQISVEGVCTELGTYPTGIWGIQSIAIHPEFGAIRVTSITSPQMRGLHVSRLNTLGQMVASDGMAYWLNNDSLLGYPNIQITDSGEIRIIWTEFARWPATGASLKFVSLDWFTPLDSPHDAQPALPREIGLRAYPNPFNSTVTIQYDLPQAGKVSLTAYDLQGRLVSTITDEFAAAGTRELRWTPENLASGVFFLNLEAPFATTTHKVLYLK